MTPVAKKIESFFQNYPSAEFKKGEVLVHAGDNPKYIIHLVKGSVRQYDISPSGEKVIVNIFKPPAFFPMSWAINKTPNDYFFEASTDIVVKVAPPDEVVRFLKENPDVSFDLLARVYSGTDGLLRRLAHLMGGGAHNRLVFELIIFAKRFGKVSADGQVVLNVSEAELGATAGLSRETVSRELGNLKKEGLLKSERQKIIILDLKKLEKNLGAEL